MERFYELEGVSRQGYFQGLARQERASAMMAEIEVLSKGYRKGKDRRAGSRSLYYNLGIKERYGLGVNKFERLMSEHGLALAPYRARLITTQSCARSRQYKNLCKGLLIDRVNQLVVGDLTYIMFAGFVCYLFLLTDVYSARIVGWELAERMRAVEAHKALLRWSQLRGRASLKGCVHHTDGGGQYFSNLYLGAAMDWGLEISVADNCLDNGFAEQRNGLIKHHFVPTVRDLSPERLRRQMKGILYFYNHDRKQEALNWLSPVDFEQKWAGHSSPPSMRLYDREAKRRTVRKGGF